MNPRPQLRCGTTKLNARMQRALVDDRLHSDLASFIRRSFETVAPGETLLFNWHIKALAYAVYRVWIGEINRLVINVPPRHLKSIVTSVAFPAFVLGHQPHRKIITVSYSDLLAAKHHNDCRAVMRSDWYRRIFPGTRISPDKNTESEFMTTRRGGRFATSITGTLTGRGGDLIIIDDPMKPEEATSEAARRRQLQWFESTLLSRLNDKMGNAIIVVMQRLHVDDLVGHLLRKGGWELLELQAIADEEQYISIGPSESFYRAAGDVLHPEREPVAVLEALKLAMGSFAFSAQYQQRPVRLEGDMIKRKWLRFYAAEPAATANDILIASWDTANKASELANHSVGTVWRVQKDNCYLVDLVRGQFDFPNLKRAVIALKNRWPGITNLIEDKGSGMSLIQELRADGLPVIAINPQADKETRLFTVQPLFEAGAVHFPKDAPWLDTLLEELLAFPNFRSNDQVDSISQALTWIQQRRRNYNNTDLGMPILVPKYEWYDV